MSRKAKVAVRMNTWCWRDGYREAGGAARRRHEARRAGQSLKARLMKVLPEYSYRVEFYSDWSSQLSETFEGDGAVPQDVLDAMEVEASILEWGKESTDSRHAIAAMQEEWEGKHGRPYPFSERMQRGN